MKKILSYLAILIAGCSPGKATVTGTVTFEGKPVCLGAVSLVASDLSTHVGELDGSGAFSIADVPAGTCRIGVKSLDPKAVAMKSKSKSSSPLSLSAGGPDKKGIRKDPPEMPNAEKWFKIPEKFSDPDTSGLQQNISGSIYRMTVTLP